MDDKPLVTRLELNLSIPSMSSEFKALNYRVDIPERISYIGIHQKASSSTRVIIHPFRQPVTISVG